MLTEDRASQRSSSEAAWLRAVVETAVDGVILIDAGGKVLGAAPYPFPGTTDFSSFLVQAQASVPAAWARRNSPHVGPDRRGAGLRRCRRSTLRTLVAERMTPSFLNSPTMRR